MGEARELAAFVQEPPIFEITSGIALVRYRTAGAVPERAMSIRTLERAIKRGQQALDRFAAGETDIIVDD